ncbi:MAG: hypothetical protein QF773_02110 [Lentisphaeria bacterium]|nr:hypothetical protein [Lentisphaeria bacterium]
MLPVVDPTTAAGAHLPVEDWHEIVFVPGMNQERPRLHRLEELFGAAQVQGAVVEQQQAVEPVNALVA